MTELARVFRLHIYDAGMTIAGGFCAGETTPGQLEAFPMVELVDIDAGTDPMLSLMQKLFQEMRLLRSDMQALRQENLALRQERAAAYEWVAEQLQAIRAEVEAGHDAARFAADAARMTADRQRGPAHVIGLIHTSPEVYWPPVSVA